MIHLKKINPDVAIRDVDMSTKVSESIKSMESLLYKVLEAIEELQECQNDQHIIIESLKDRMEPLESESKRWVFK